MLATSNIARDNVSSYYNKYISKHKTAYLSKQTMSYSVIVYTHNAFQVNRVISTFLLFFGFSLYSATSFKKCFVMFLGKLPARRTNKCCAKTILLVFISSLDTYFDLSWIDAGTRPSSAMHFFAFFLLARSFCRLARKSRACLLPSKDFIASKEKQVRP